MMITYNYKSLAQAAGISEHILREERKKLFESNSSLRLKFGDYEHNVLTPDQLQLLVDNIALLKKIKV